MKVLKNIKCLTFQILFLIFLLMFSNEIFPQDDPLDKTFGQDGIVTTSINISEGASESNSTAIQRDSKIIVAGFGSSLGKISFAVVRYNKNGTQDNTFGTNGIVVTSFGTGVCYATSAVVQSDGKIVVAGDYDSGVASTNYDFALVRYNPNGSLDSTFGINGTVITPVSKTADLTHSVAIQSDGKIVVGGATTFNENNYTFALARYNINGGLDNSFGVNGISILHFGTDYNNLYSIAVQADGKIVAAGNSGDGNFAVIRFNTNGDRDNTFGTQGVVTIPATSGTAYSVKIQADNKIVIAGTSLNGSLFEFTLARCDTKGNIDQDFGKNGISIIPVGSKNYGFLTNSLELQNDGKIIIVGSADNSSLDVNFVLVRCNSNGNVDSTYGINGIVQGISGYANSALIQDDGKIIITGYSLKGNNNVITTACYNQNGELDNTFGVNGIASTYIGYESDAITAVTVQDDDKIIAEGGNESIALARYDLNGNLDNTFGTSGTISEPGLSGLTSVAIQSNGKIIAGGTTYNFSNSYDFGLIRFNSNGFIDNSFGSDNNGIVTTKLSAYADEIFSIAIQKDDKILAAGIISYPDHYSSVMARYNKDGILDKDFGTDGIVITNTTNCAPRSVKVQNDGKIITAGYILISGDYDFIISRFNTDGKPDNTFGTNGSVITPIGISDDFATSLALQNDGKIVAAGSTLNRNDYDIALSRYKTNGDLDSTFGSDGIVIIPIEGSDERANSIAIQNNGKIVAAGRIINGINSNSVIVRYNQNGTLDSTFGKNGIAIISIGSSESSINSIAVQKDDKIVAAGYASNNNNFSVFSLIRFKEDPSTGIEKEPFEIPSSFRLKQNYPNPFNPSTTIKYSIPKASNVTLKVYDILGREVASLVNEEKTAGSYQINFNAANLASGVYLYRITAGNFVDTKKFIILK